MISEGFVMKGGVSKGPTARSVYKHTNRWEEYTNQNKCTGMIKLSCKYETQTKKNGNEMETKETLVGGGAEKFG